MSGGEQQTTHREEGDFRDQKPGESPEPPIAAYHPLLQESIKEVVQTQVGDALAK